MLRVLLLLIVPSIATSWKVLFANVFNTGSHQTVAVHVANLLADNGHNITYMSTNIPRSSLRPTIRILDLPKCTAAINSLTNPPANETKSATSVLYKIDFFFRACERWYTEESVQGLMQSGEKFDLFVTSGLFETCALGLANHLGIENAIIQMPGAILTPYLIHEMGLPLYSSSTDIHVLTIRESSEVKSSITARVTNIAKRFLVDVLYYGFMGWYSEPTVYKNIANYPGYRETYKTVKLMLMHYHHHPLIDTPTPLGPGVLPLAGTLCKPYNPQDISPDLLEFLDSATEGVVFLSFGSIQKDGDHEEQNKLIEVFKGMPYKVVWKQNKAIDDIPDNVKLVTWVGQMSLLQHPNIKLFITHGGYASKTEALCAGVPLLVVPRFAVDQFYTAQRITDSGLGGQIPKLEITTAPEMLAQVLEIIENPAYSLRAQHVKEQMLQTRTSDEQVMGYIGAAVSGHGFLPGRQPWYEFLYLDIIAVPLLTVLCVRMLYRKWATRKE